MLHGLSSGYVVLAENTGSHEQPAFNRRRILHEASGKPIDVGYDASPRAVDWDGDGDVDLLAGGFVTGWIFHFENVGKLANGTPDLRARGPLKIDGQPIDTGWAAAPEVADLDGDGDLDLICGAHSGHIWFHENRGDDRKPDLDEVGYRLPLADGGLVQVGEPPAGKKPGFNFTDLQGARPKPAPADFDRDGRVDLVIGDTYGRVRFFRNLGRDGEGRHTFAAPVMIHKSRSRLSIHAGDWDGDEAVDVFVITGQRVDLFRNRALPGRCEFEEPERLKLPAAIGGFYGVAPVDLNNDGDTDLVYHTSSRITCYVERSFLKHGYRQATIMSIEKRDK